MEAIRPSIKARIFAAVSAGVKPAPAKRARLFSTTIASGKVKFRWRMI
jgi:hypothetical protein